MSRDSGSVIRVGDVLAVPLGPGMVGVGYVAAEYSPSLAFYLLLYGQSYPAIEDIEPRAVAGDPVLCGLTNDAKVFAGHWSVVGNLPPDPGSLPLPASKVGQRGQMIVEDVTGEFWRLATEDEIERLAYRKVVAPVRLENALKAHFGLRDWDPIFDDLRIVSPDRQARNIIVAPDEE